MSMFRSTRDWSRRLALLLALACAANTRAGVAGDESPIGFGTIVAIGPMPDCDVNAPMGAVRSGALQAALAQGGWQALPDGGLSYQLAWGLAMHRYAR